MDVLRPGERSGGVPNLPVEQPCSFVHEIAIAGASDHWRLHWLRDATAPFVGRCIGVQGIARIAAHLDGLLIESGYVTSRVSLRPQNLAAGRLEFQLHAGRIAQLRMVDADSPSRPADTRWGAWRNAFPTDVGALLNARDLEQGVEQMQRLPSQRVTTTIEPGSQLDTSVLTIARHAGGWRERIRGGVTLDNSGGPVLGRTQLSTSMALDNPLGLNDIVSLNANSNVERLRSDHRSQGASLSYGVPLGYSSLSLSASRSRFAQIVQLPTLPHLSSGKSSTAELRLAHVLFRTSSAKIGAFASLSTRRSRGYLDDTELLTQRRRTTLLDTGLNLRHVLPGNSSVDVEVAYRRGVPWLSAQDDLDKDPLDPDATPTLRPRIWSFNASLAVPFEQPAAEGWGARGWQYSLTLRGQHSRDRTLSIDHFAVGNRSSVRGFDGYSVLLAESGWSLRNELATAANLAGAQGQFYAGVDLGRVWGPSDSLLLGRRLAGVVFGWRGRFERLQVDLAAAAPLAKPRGFQTESTSFYASATVAF